MNNTFHKQIPLVLALSSAVFLTGGWLYYRSFLFHFGINSNAFFSLTDYISAGIDAVIYNCIQVIVAWIIIYLQTKNKLFARIIQTIVGISIIISLISLTISFVNPTIFQSLGQPIVIRLQIIASLLFSIAYLTVPFLILSNKISKTAYIWIFTLLFLIVVPFSALITAYQPPDKLSIFNGGEFKIEVENESFPGFKLILANSSYYFMISENTKQIVIVPAHQVKYIKITK
ncbi:MAG: hypothetical protein BGO43_04135 [Gammaproteobacteria bacterium 39-13]|nr:hypothetical protein [Gammaproteobacteria bacterium]OJV94879.1 MAG: hypothetical protein BGO43_04135 [Gammaproteobacteria bacterium 39-13]